MAKKGGSQTVSQRLDPEMQAQVQRMFGLAADAGNVQMPGLSAPTQQAIDTYGRFASGGNLGLGALGGDPNAIKALMNPYEEGVINATMGDFSHLRDQTLGSVNDQATQAGAFGGSRHGVAEGVALGELGRGEQSTLAGLRSSGFDSAMGRAGTLANFGLMGAAGSAGLGKYARDVAIDQDPALHRYAVAKDAITGTPYGTTQTTRSSSNPLAAILGAITTGAGLFGSFGQGGAPASTSSAPAGGDYGQGGGLSPQLLTLLGML